MAEADVMEVDVMEADVMEADVMEADGAVDDRRAGIGQSWRAPWVPRLAVWLWRTSLGSEPSRA